MKSHETIKRILSLLLCFSMIVSVSSGAFAAEIETEDNGTILSAGVHPGGTTYDQPFDRGVGGSDEFRIPAIITLQNGWLLAAADARWSTSGDGGGLDTIVSISKDNGKTWQYSLPIYFPDSDGYAGTLATTAIDPAVVQAEDGTIYVMVDMNPTGVTTMTDYTYPNLGTGFITVDGVERLALTDNYSNTNTAPDEEDTTTYGYYVGDEVEEGYFAVIDRTTGKPSEYVVDECLNLFITQEDGSYTIPTQTQVNDSETLIQQNAMYRGSALHVYNTGYIWAAYSKDNGESWNHKILNPQIKRETETGLLVSPGRGTLLRDGTVIVPFYCYYDTSSQWPSTQTASFIWSKDDGETWTRTPHVPGNVSSSSESEIVELADGTLRMFVRSGLNAVAYADAAWNEETGNYEWSELVSTGVPCRSGCNVSAIMYSEQIDGKDAILVACPGNTGSRTQGRIFVFLVEEDNSMSLGYTFHVNETAYAYSCLTEHDDGTVGLLWEYMGSAITYSTYDINEIVGGGKVNGTRTLTVPLYGTLTVESAEEFAPDLTESDIVSIDITKNVNQIPMAQLGTNNTFGGQLVDLETCLYTFTATTEPDLNDNTAVGWIIESSSNPGVYLNQNVSPGFPNQTTGVKTYVESPTETGFTLRAVKFDSNKNTNVNRIIHFHKTLTSNNASKLYSFDCGGSKSVNTDFLIYRPAAENESGSAEIPGYVRIASADELVSGNSYLIAAKADNGYYLLHPSSSTSDRYSHVAKVVLVDPPVRAKLGTDETYGGEAIPVADCLYTFTGDNTNGWTVQSVTSSSLYLNHVGGSPGFPNSTASRAVYLTDGKLDGFCLYVIDNNGKNSRLYFHKAEKAGMTYSFNRQGSLDANGQTDFLLYRPAAENESGSAEIPGYVRIASADELVSGSSYLIVSHAGADYYLLHPSADTSNRYSHAAKLIPTASGETSYTIVYTGLKDGTETFTDTISGDLYEIRVKPDKLEQVTVALDGTRQIRLGTSTEITHEADASIAEAEVAENTIEYTVPCAMGNLGTDATYSGNAVSLFNALYTFELNEDGNTYTVSSKTTGGTTVYLGLRNGMAGFPQTTDASAAGAISLSYFSGSTESFVINSAGSYNGNLYFHQNDSKPLRFDQQGSTTNQIQLEFFLFRPANEGEECAKIPGFVQLTSPSEIVSGSQYLIVHDIEGEYYALYPSASTSDYYSHAVHVNPDLEPDNTGAEFTYYTLDITGVAQGTTDVMVGSLIYRITVVESNSSDVIDMIDAIGQVTVDSEDAIEEARNAYDALTDEEKEQVSNYADLTAAEATLKNLKAAAEVEVLIDAIGEVTLDSGDDIQAARDAYNALTQDQKKMVSNYKDLIKAERALINLRNEKAADDVQALIEAIGQVTVDDEEAITAARDAYEALTPTQKRLVDNLDVLEEAEIALVEAKDKAAAKIVEALIDAISDEITAEDAQDIKTARSEYENLTAKQKLLVENYEDLTAAEQALIDILVNDLSAAQKELALAEDALEKAEVNLKAAEDKLSDAEAELDAAQKNLADAEEKAELAEAAAQAALADAAASQEEKDAAVAAAKKAREDADIAASEAAEAEATAVIAREEAEKAVADKEAAQLALEKATEALAAANQAQKDAEAEAALAQAKYNAVVEISELANMLDQDLTMVQKMKLNDAEQDAYDAIANAVSVEEVEKAVTDAAAAMELAATEDIMANYVDVKKASWYYNYVEYMVHNGYMIGTSDTTFEPNGTLTRAQLVTIVYRMNGSQSVEGMDNPFTDVKDGKWYTDAVVWAANAGIVKGVSETSFQPDSPITREQIVTILFRYDGALATETDCLASFSDGDQVSRYAVDAMNWAIENELINGVSETVLDPLSYATRAQISAILMRYCEI